MTGIRWYQLPDAATLPSVTVPRSTVEDVEQVWQRDSNKQLRPQISVAAKQQLRECRLVLSVGISGWHSAILLFAMHRQILLSVISIPPLSQADSSGCILQSFFRGLLATFSLLMIYFSSPIKVYLQFENAAIHNTTFLMVVLCICQDKAAWYCIDLYFVQKDSGNIRSCVCSSTLVQRMVRQTLTFSGKTISAIYLPSRSILYWGEGLVLYSQKVKSVLTQRAGEHLQRPHH